jgi:hypothetical protein
VTVNKLPMLNLCQSLSKAKLCNGSEVATLVSRPKSTHAFNKKFSFGLEWTDLTFKLTHITSNNGAAQPSLGSWVIERQNYQVKYYVSSSLFNHCFRVFISFQNKLRDSFVWHSQVSQYMWHLWILTKAIKTLCLFLFLPLRLMCSS